MATRAPAPASARLAWLAVLSVGVASAVLRYRYLASAGTPVGVDGYYYLIQVRSLLDDGHLYYPSAPLVLWLMAAVAKVSSPLVGVQLIAALGTAAIGIPIAGIARRLGHSPGSAAVAAIVATTAPSSLYLSAEFAKNGVALTIACVYLWALAAAASAPSARTAWWRAAALLVVTALSHKLALVFAIALSVPVLVASQRRWASFAIATAIVAIILVGIALPGGLPTLSDASALTRMWSTTPRWSLPIFAFDDHELRFSFDVLLAAGVALATVILAVTRKAPALVLAAAVWTLMVAIPLVDVADANGLGPRLRLTAFVSMALCAPFVLDRASASWRRATRVAVFAGIAVGVLAARPRVPVEGVTRMREPLIAALENLPPGERVIVVPERQLVFAATWYTGMRATLRPESIARGQRLRLLPGWFASPELTVAIRATMGDPPPGIAPPVALNAKEPLALVAVSEPTWEYLVTRLPAGQRGHYRDWPTL